MKLSDLPAEAEAQPQAAAPRVRLSDIQRPAAPATPQREDPMRSFTPGNVARAAGAIATGVAGGALGFPGDIETLVRGVSANTSNIRGPLQSASESILPTSRRVERFIAGEPSGDVERGFREVGELLSPVMAGRAASAAGRLTARAALGVPSRSVEELARAAEARGFRFEPMQLRESKPMGSPGFGSSATANQRLANRLASETTGKATNEITPAFLGERLETLGKEIGDIFNRPFRLDSQMVSELERMRDFEAAVRPATAQSVAPAAHNLIERYNQAAGAVGPGGNVSRFSVPGNELQALRSEMSDIARSATDGSVRRRAQEFVTALDGAIQRFNPEISGRLQAANRRYAATSTLRDLVESGGIRGGNISLEKLGGAMAREAYGFGSGTSRHPLAELGMMGRELKMRALWEGAQTPPDTLGALTSRVGRVLGVAGRMQPARRLQRGASEARPAVTGGEAAASGLAATGRRFED